MPLKNHQAMVETPQKFVCFEELPYRSLAQVTKLPIFYFDVGPSLVLEEYLMSIYFSII